MCMANFSSENGQDPEKGIGYRGSSVEFIGDTAT